jgi:hypothetical protein
MLEKIKKIGIKVLKIKLSLRVFLMVLFFIALSPFISKLKFAYEWIYTDVEAVNHIGYFTLRHDFRRTIWRNEKLNIEFEGNLGFAEAIGTKSKAIILPNHPDESFFLNFESLYLNNRGFIALVLSIFWFIHYYINAHLKL